jgi:hypothetical protein
MLGEDGDDVGTAEVVAAAAVVLVVLAAEGSGARVVNVVVAAALSELEAAPPVSPWVAVAWLIAAQPLPVGGASARVSIVVTYLPGLGISRLLLSWLPHSELGRLTLNMSSNWSNSVVFSAPLVIVIGAQFM